MRSMIDRVVRPVIALVLAGLLSPALAGYAAAAQCRDAGMPCCRTMNPSAARLAAGCCRLQQQRAPIQPAVKVVPQSRPVSMVSTGASFVSNAAVSHDPSRSLALSPPAPDNTPLYVRLSVIRR